MSDPSPEQLQAIIFRSFELTLSATLRALRGGDLQAVPVDDSAPWHGQVVRVEGKDYRLVGKRTGALEAILQVEEEAIRKDAAALKELRAEYKALAVSYDRLGKGYEELYNKLWPPRIVEKESIIERDAEGEVIGMHAREIHRT